MISDEAYEKIQAEVQKRNLHRGVLSECLLIYIKDYRALLAENPKMAKKQIHAMLMRPTGISSLVNIAEEKHLSGAIKVTKTYRTRVELLSFAISVMAGFFANIVFTAVMIGFFIVAQDVTNGFFKKIGNPAYINKVEDTPKLDLPHSPPADVLEDK